MAREASVERNTKETQIKLKISLDGTGCSHIETGVGFFDHMLSGFARHGLFDLEVEAKGDLEVIAIIRWRIPGLFWEMRLQMRWTIRRASSGTEASCCLWTKRWPCVQSICPVGRI